MDGIYYNQEVTAEMLNAIVTDLGNTTFNGFGAEKFGANELNDITAALVGSGVLTTGNMCRVVKTDSGFAVQDGTIVFANGAKKTIGTAIDITVNEACAIYALNNTTAGTCTIETADDFPAEGDFVRLAKMNSSGGITDCRTVAKAKLELYSGNNEVSKEYSLSYGAEFVKIADFSALEWAAHSYLLLSNVGGFVKISGASTGGTEYAAPTAASYEIYLKFLRSDDTVSVYAKVQRGNWSGNVILI